MGLNVISAYRPQKACANCRHMQRLAAVHGFTDDYAQPYDDDEYFCMLDYPDAENRRDELGNVRGGDFCRDRPEWGEWESGHRVELGGVCDRHEPTKPGDESR